MNIIRLLFWKPNIKLDSIRPYYTDTEPGGYCKAGFERSQTTPQGYSGPVSTPHHLPRGQLAPFLPEIQSKKT